MPSVVISSAQSSDLLAVLQTNSHWTAVIGSLPDGTNPPAVAAWPITPVNAGESLASEDGGIIIDVWQINCFGRDVGQAKAVRDALLSLDWPDGWELNEIGPFLPDTAPKPIGYFVPVDYRYRVVQ